MTKNQTKAKPSQPFTKAKVRKKLPAKESKPTYFRRVDGVGVGQGLRTLRFKPSETEDMFRQCLRAEKWNVDGENHIVETNRGLSMHYGALETCPLCHKTEKSAEKRVTRPEPETPPVKEKSQDQSNEQTVQEIPVDTPEIKDEIDLEYEAAKAILRKKGIKLD